MASPPADTSVQQPLFRASRKRKATYRRQREEDESEPTTDTPAPLADSASPSLPSTTAEDDESSIAEALRLRNLRKSRLNGVGFRAQTREDEPSSSTALIPKPQDEETAPDGGITNRFAPQTGLVGELVNKHMPATDQARMEYIEAKLSNRPSPSTPAPEAGAQSEPRAPTAPSSRPPRLDEIPGAAIMQGRLTEVDLGDEARARNIAMTEAARRLQTAPTDSNDGGAPGQRARKKTRLGRDGKPLRQRNRRTSDDVARDKMVEDFLRENRLDVYENPATSQTANSSAPGGGDDDAAADDRLAEEFRREFMDAMAHRRQQNAQQQQQRKKAPADGKADEEVLRGPKLGGSRSARAAMRDLLLAEEKKKQQGRR
ncbi:hypothetical protein D7B24_000060 [Verticillium nonalfalfae]|uniref:Uncharacterized protein n=1 Tax=Verticillium nonalfalfae TaxID=1051616 RepID=A0A3M9YKS6_9PEZI|nr:uncharacterized protein D7B24_000060 [Verticillium nonalfalfae]RNJ61207.1 hypothetical protein D7B24_000060 [Verticillium nonalfalfae]